MAADDLVDVVDEFDRVERVTTREWMRRDNLRHRGVGIAVLDSEDRLLIHRRADDKDVWPGFWDMAAGGVLASGESYLDGARRELSEELGIVDTPLRFVGEQRFEDESVRVITHCFIARHDGDIAFNDGEVAEARWITAEEFADLVDVLTWCPDSLSMVPNALMAHARRWRYVLGAAGQQAADEATGTTAS
jgi:isopentenyldiphosphate isomerase